jgi:hypothetical protein
MDLGNCVCTKALIVDDEFFEQVGLQKMLEN